MKDKPVRIRCERCGKPIAKRNLGRCARCAKFFSHVYGHV